MNLPAFATPGNQNAALAAIVAALPPLPRAVLYEDDYDEVIRSVVVDQLEDRLELFVSGRQRVLNLLEFEPVMRRIVRHFLLTELLDFAPASVAHHFQGLRGIPGPSLAELVLAPPLQLRGRWINVVTPTPRESQVAAKAFLKYLCDFELGAWAPRFKQMVSGLPVPRRDQYAVVRAGDCFLEIEEEGIRPAKSS